MPLDNSIPQVLVSSNLLTAAGLDHAAGRPKTNVDCRGHLIVSGGESVESDEIAMETSGRLLLLSRPDSYHCTDDVSMDIDDDTSTTTSAWTTIKESVSALEAIVENLSSMESIATPLTGGSSFNNAWCMSMICQRPLRPW